MYSDPLAPRARLSWRVEVTVGNRRLFASCARNGGVARGRLRHDRLAAPLAVSKL